MKPAQDHGNGSVPFRSGSTVTSSTTPAGVPRVRGAKLRRNRPCTSFEFRWTGFRVFDSVARATLNRYVRGQIADEALLIAGFSLLISHHACSGVQSKARRCRAASPGVSWFQCRRILLRPTRLASVHRNPGHFHGLVQVEVLVRPRQQHRQVRIEGSDNFLDGLDQLQRAPLDRNIKTIRATGCWASGIYTKSMGSLPSLAPLPTGWY